MFRNAVEGGMAGVFGAVLFGLFDFFPVRPDFAHVLDFRLAKDVRMPAHQFLHDQPADFFEIKRAPLLRQLAVENNLHQQIAEFLGHFVVVVRLDGVNQFIDLLDGMAAERAMVLLAVPRTARRRAQPGHDFEQIVDGGRFFHLENIEHSTFNIEHPMNRGCDRNLDVGVQC